MKKPLILICNDDGVTAPGIKSLIASVRDIGDIVVVAPDKPQSGSGHGITINATLRMDKISEEKGLVVYSCSGTPVDCIKLALHKMEVKPTIILSGINHGSNASINVIYSGTMSAAIEGALEGIPSIGFSLLNHSIDARFNASRIITRKITLEAIKNGIPKGICLNVNIPNLEYDNLMGIKVCRQANGNWEEEFESRLDPAGKEYFWLTGTFKNYDEGEDTDIWALEHNYVSVVPVKYDMTAQNDLQTIKNWKFER